MLYQSKRRVKSNINRTFYAFSSKDEKMCKKGLKTFCMDCESLRLRLSLCLKHSSNPLKLHFLALIIIGCWHRELQTWQPGNSHFCYTSLKSAWIRCLGPCIVGALWCKFSTRSQKPDRNPHTHLVMTKSLGPKRTQTIIKALHSQANAIFMLSGENIVFEMHAYMTDVINGTFRLM